jgi:hypothetical protein
MLRFFISPHPTFKSYKAPDKERVEKSPYYWWWYALTLNDEYLAVCESADGAPNGGKLLESCEEKIRQVYRDFGDVRYVGDRHKAFCDWWRAPISTEESRGEYLFAEPVHASTVNVLDCINDAEGAIASDDTLVISIPLSRQRQHVDKAIDRLLKRHMRTEKGRAVRNPSQSKARYHLGKAAVPSALKKIFTIYDCKLDTKNSLTKTTNIDIAYQTGIARLSGTESDNEILNAAAKNRILSVQVSRYLKSAKNIIKNVGLGTFP